MIRRSRSIAQNALTINDGPSVWQIDSVSGDCAAGRTASFGTLYVYSS
eukprot:CAMPEP_0206317376 /NCGR_PEP_ID=MMETSP0106_2-20121207/16608_1 /ASSEMBLY_ACC=CAM_ASM_000206 /TAXON_ID=81532 /ORGANISM="Acanthoeca-like sp., Strain 10tr" /LENGTH=47 /DNA_ID= /DNA_START= /DNA_END= /DNA_ORIENTATION=